MRGTNKYSMIFIEINRTANAKHLATGDLGRKNYIYSELVSELLNIKHFSTPRTDKTN